MKTSRGKKQIFEQLYRDISSPSIMFYFFPLLDINFTYFPIKVNTCTAFDS